MCLCGRFHHPLSFPSPSPPSWEISMHKSNQGTRMISPPPLPFTFTFLFYSLSVPTTLCNSSPLLSLYHIIQTSVYLTYKHFENKNEINKRESLFFFFNAINCWLKLDSIQTDLRAWEFPWWFYYQLWIWQFLILKINIGWLISVSASNFFFFSALLYNSPPSHLLMLKLHRF